MGHLSRRCIGTDALVVGIQGNTEKFFWSLFSLYFCIFMGSKNGIAKKTHPYF